MRALKTKPRTRSRPVFHKRGRASWRVGAGIRRLWSSSWVKGLLLAGTFAFACAFLWWKEYPQKLIQLVSHSVASGMGRAGFSLADVLVEGRKNVPIEKILGVVNARQGAPLFAYNPYGIKKQLEEISWVRQATVKRQLPDTLFIQLQERQPVALWQHHQQFYLVDEQGVIISSDNLHSFSYLPVIVGGDAPVHAPHLLHLLEKFPEIRKKVTALVRVSGRRWDLHLDKTLHVKLPETKVEEAFVRLNLLMKRKKINPAEVSVVDLRIHNKVILHLSPAAAMRLKRKGKET